jgi:uncharacterized protein YkwD
MIVGMKRTISILLAALALLATMPTFRPAAAKQQLEAGDVIIQVNALRAAKGLAPLKANQTLMAAAQAHSEYQASIGYTTYTGPDGSRPTSRARAAGFGEGANVSVSENVASGMNLTPTSVVAVWQGDTQELNTMLSPIFTDAGVGIANDGRVTYITLDVGYITNQVSANQTPATSTAAGSPTGATATATPKGFFLTTVATVTPQTDGSIVHIVQPGEVLLNIAIAYNVKLSQLYELNYLNDKSVIYPGQKLKIKGPDPTTTPTATATPTHIPTATHRPTRTPTLPPTVTSTDLAVSPTATQPQATPKSGFDPLLISIGILVIVGLGLLVAGSLLKRKSTSRD